MAFIGERGKIFLVLLLLWLAYVVVGIFIFTAVEGTAQLYDREWGYEDSFWFVIVLLTTIGYGDFSPATALGKALCVLYAIFGIPVTILLLRLIGQFILRGQRCFITWIEKRCLRINGPTSHLNGKCFLLGLIYLLLLLLVGAGVQMWAEEWSYENSLYFYVISFTTVGFGDLLPTNKYITVPFILLGLTAVSNVLHAAASMALVKRVTVGSKDEQTEENEAKV
ncbi:potassium channel subfamily K member 9-like [Montipora foliosa]|uniref:potassium channel subfamily K member 9-like n=1 Tax=Montipora foliosa TaxID=591990 RepID=UPI0035F16529